MATPQRIIAMSHTFHLGNNNITERGVHLLTSGVWPNLERVCLSEYHEDIDNNKIGGKGL